jgi:pretoxin HINT domain-containing protein
MPRRTWTILGSLAALLVLATPVWAPPPCSYMASQSICNQTCYLEGAGSCVSVTLDSSCIIHYVCTAGTLYGTCDCTIEPGPGGGCFLAGTRITMADRTTKPIEEIAVGDVVLAYDKASGEMKPDPVKRLHKPVTVDSYLLVNDHLRITKTQPVFSAGQWVEMGELKVGDTLTAADGHAVPIETLVVVDTPITVYNFDTNPYETFVAEGFIVHRKQETTPP